MISLHISPNLVECKDRIDMKQLCILPAESGYS